MAPEKQSPTKKLFKSPRLFKSIKTPVIAYNQKSPKQAASSHTPQTSPKTEITFPLLSICIAATPVFRLNPRKDAKNQRKSFVKRMGRPGVLDAPGEFFKALGGENPALVSKLFDNAIRAPKVRGENNIHAP